MDHINKIQQPYSLRACLCNPFPQKTFRFLRKCGFSCVQCGRNMRNCDFFHVSFFRRKPRNALLMREVSDFYFPRKTPSIFKTRFRSLSQILVIKKQKRSSGEKKPDLHCQFEAVSIFLSLPQSDLKNPSLFLTPLSIHLHLHFFLSQ